LLLVLSEDRIRTLVVGVAMSLFRCSKCGCEDDTALSNYWSARLKEMPAVCSACDPKIGKWHGEFPRRNETLKESDRGGAVKNLVGLTRLIDVRAKLAEANREMAVAIAERDP
jgi:hypothetical protein